MNYLDYVILSVIIIYVIIFYMTTKNIMWRKMTYLFNVRKFSDIVEMIIKYTVLDCVRKKPLLHVFF